MIFHPEFGNDFADQLSVTKKAHHGAFRNDNSHGFGDCAYIGGGNMAATKSQRDVHLRGHGIEIATRGENDTRVTDHKPTIQLGQFLDGSPWIEISEMPRRLRMTH